MSSEPFLPGTSPKKEEKVEDMTFSLPQPEPIKGFPELRWTGKRPFTSTHYSRPSSRSATATPWTAG